MPPGYCVKCKKDTVIGGRCASATCQPDDIPEPDREVEVVLVAGEECPTCGYKVPVKSTERVKEYRERKKAKDAD